MKLSQLRTGDIIAEHGNKALSKAIQGITRSPYNHLSTYLGHGYVGEALAGGYQINSVTESLKECKGAIVKRPRFKLDYQVLHEKVRDLDSLHYDFLGIVVIQPVYQFTEFVMGRGVWIGGKASNPRRAVMCSTAAAWLCYEATYHKYFKEWYKYDPQDVADNFTDFDTFPLEI